MIDIAKMSERGQIIIPKDMRDAVGAKNGAIFTMIAVQGKIIMKIVDQEKIRKDLEDFWEMRAKAHKFSAEEIDKMIHDARAEIRGKKSSSRC